MYACMHACLYVCQCMYVNVCTYVYIYIYVCHIHVNIHTHMYLYIYILIDKYLHIYTCKSAPMALESVFFVLFRAPFSGQELRKPSSPRPSSAATWIQWEGLGPSSAVSRRR